MARSIAAIAAGFFLTLAVAFAADELLLRFVPDTRDALGRVTDWRILVLMLGYTAAAAMAGSYLTARLAPSRPLQHALILGAIALALTLAATVMFWASGPAWYHASAVVMVLPCAWIGGTLAAPRRVRAPAGA